MAILTEAYFPVGIMAALARWFALLFHFALCLLALLVSAVPLLTGVHTLNLPWLPWSGSTLTWWLFGLSLAGFVATILAMFNKFRLLFLVWALIAVYFLGRGFLFSGHKFGGAEEFRIALYILAAALVAVFGAVSKLRQPLTRRW
jgi:hypothetical protein